MSGSSMFMWNTSPIARTLALSIERAHRTASATVTDTLFS